MQIELMFASLLLREWKKNPNVRRIDLTFVRCNEKDPKDYLPLPEKEIAMAKQLLREHAPSDYYSIFPEERQVG